VMGEGAGILVLEEGSKARERGARILGRVRGYGATSDAHHLTAPQPNGEGAARAIELALKDAGVEPEQVIYVNAHGTSTPLNDRAETEALKTALGERRARELPVSSTKSAIGHLLGAAGAVEAIATLLALRDRMAPPTLNYEEPDEGLDLDYVPDGARPLANGDTPAIGISNSFGFGGHNAVLCLEAVA
ncbi:MAG: beta-ketoacyl-[acyl-carrier-protein] synthase family protein, partial [Thermoleophilaceae bacterium]